MSYLVDLHSWRQLWWILPFFYLNI
jgi:hypothetical protein